MRRLLIISLVILVGISVLLLTRSSSSSTPSSRSAATPSPSQAVTAPPATKTSLANPASENCVNQGGKVVIMTRGDSGQYGLCDFGDGMACEEWALLRNACPEGGVRTTGFDTIEQKYCAWSGGKTLAVPDATCTFPDGSACDALAYYNGACQKGARNMSPPVTNSVQQ